MSIPRLINPQTNATGLSAAAGAIYAAVVMIYNAHYHHGVISVPVVVAAVAAVAALLARHSVTPVADPKDGAGRRLVPEPEHAPLLNFPAPGNVHVVPDVPLGTSPAPSGEQS